MRSSPPTLKADRRPFTALTLAALLAATATQAGIYAGRAAVPWGAAQPPSAGVVGQPRAMADGAPRSPTRGVQHWSSGLSLPRALPDPRTSEPPFADTAGSAPKPPLHRRAARTLGVGVRAASRTPHVQRPRPAMSGALVPQARPANVVPLRR